VVAVGGAEDDANSRHRAFQAICAPIAQLLRCEGKDHLSVSRVRDLHQGLALLSGVCITRGRLAVDSVYLFVTSFLTPLTQLVVMASSGVLKNCRIFFSDALLVHNSLLSAITNVFVQVSEFQLDFMDEQYCGEFFEASLKLISTFHDLDQCAKVNFER
jgi:hypothetical protein